MDPSTIILIPSGPERLASMHLLGHSALADCVEVVETANYTEARPRWESLSSGETVLWSALGAINGQGSMILSRASTLDVRSRTALHTALGLALGVVSGALA